MKIFEEKMFGPHTRRRRRERKGRQIWRGTYRERNHLAKEI